MQVTVPGFALHRDPIILNSHLGSLRANPALHHGTWTLAHDEQHVGELCYLTEQTNDDLAGLMSCLSALSHNTPVAKIALKVRRSIEESETLCNFPEGRMP